MPPLPMEGVPNICLTCFVARAFSHNAEIFLPRPHRLGAVNNASLNRSMRAELEENNYFKQH